MEIALEKGAEFLAPLLPRPDLYLHATPNERITVTTCRTSDVDVMTHATEASLIHSSHPPNHSLRT